MFKCKLCNVNVGPNIKTKVLVVETRPKTYGRLNWIGVLVPIGHGIEIVKELRVCPKCWRKAEVKEQLRLETEETEQILASIEQDQKNLGWESSNESNLDILQQNYFSDIESLNLWEEEQPIKV